MKIHQFMLLALICDLAARSADAGPTKYPGLNFIHPVALHRGSVATVLVDTNGDLTAAYKALVEGSGVTATVLPRKEKAPAGQVEVEFRIDANAEVGPREVRIATKAAITTAGSIYISAFPVAVSDEKNDTPEQAMAVQFPQTICARLEKDVDEDWFRFAAKKGERVHFTVFGTRLHETIHKIGRFIPHLDVSLSLTDSEGIEVAANDDHFFADPHLAFVAPRDGEYFLRVSEATYKGNPFYTYALNCCKGPAIWQARPFGIEVGQTASRRLFGPGIPENAAAEFKMPDIAEGRIAWLRPVNANFDGNEVALLACGLPIVEEKEPNNDSRSAIPLNADTAVMGSIDAAGDEDWFVLDAKKGSVFEFEVFARRLFTPLDSEIAVFNDKNARLAESDDHRPFASGLTKDSFLIWTAPTDGRFAIRLRDKLRRGGPEFGYQLTCRAGRPDFELSCDPVYSMIGPGSRSPIFVRTNRKHGFDGPIRIEIRGLPPGVKAYVDELRLPNQDAMIVLEAESGAKIDAANVEIVGSAAVTWDGKPVELVRKATPVHEIYQAQRRTGRTVAVAVTEPSDIRVETELKEIKLRPGETVEIPITVTRAEKYKDGPVTLWENWRFNNTVFGSTLPPGVSIVPDKSKLALNGADSKGVIALAAAANAKPCDAVQFAALAQVAIEYSVFVPYCTAPIRLSVLAK